MKSFPFTTLKKTILSAAAASLLFTSSLSADCTYELFSISSAKGTKIADFVDQLSDECSFSIVVTDPEAEKVLDKSLNKTNLKNLTIDEVLDLILTENNLNYTLENSILKVSYIQTRTFNIDYIITQRKSLGSTDIMLSSQSGTTGGAGTETSAMSSGSTEAGVKIESSDEVKFWDELDKELERVLNRPEDTYKAEAPIININAGMITVSGTVKQLKRLEAYLEELQKKIQYQVLIDVNLYSVVLSDGSSTGIDWSQLYALQNIQLTADMLHAKNVSTYEDGQITEGVYGDISSPMSLFEMSAAGTLKEVIKFLKTQGDVKAISNPKVLTLNNQPALITVGTEYFYSVEESTQQQASGGGVAATLQTTVISSVFAGVLLDITPEIAHDGTITLKINPSVTQTRETMGADNTDRTMPPDLERRQLASVVTVQDGGRVILGGLINTRNTMDTNKVPLLGDIPILGYLFKREEKRKEVEELVLVIEPHIIKKEGKTVSLADLGYSGISEKDLDSNTFLLETEKDDESKGSKEANE